MDSADEAGGEAVFTSDGLPSLAAPLPPPPIGGGGSGSAAAKAGGVGDDDAVVEEESNPRAVFEAFNEVGGWSLSARPSSSGGGPSSAVGGWEDPRRRLFRLRAEIDQLEAAFARENERGKQDAAGEGHDDDEELQATTAELKSRLTAMGLEDSASLATMLRGRQEDLSKVIARDLEKFGTRSDISDSLGKMSLEGGSTKAAETGDGKIVYELYRDSAAASKSSSVVPREVMLEERLRKLELAMGTTTTKATDGEKTILERIEEAERLTREVDAKQIEKLAAKAKVVRADLEAAARARTKLASKSSNNNSSQQQKEDAQTISALHAQMAELEGISAHLPALTVRLLELSTLHASAAEFASRLDAAESAVNRSEAMLTSVEEALSKMEGGWKANMDLVEKNVERLDGLLAKSGGS